MKKVNYYYLTAGFLAILFAITHELNGQNTALVSLHSSNIKINTVTVFEYIWHIITVENFVFGIAFIIMAFNRNMENVRFAALLVCAILIVRLFVILGTTLIFVGLDLSELMVDIAAITIYTAIILLGARKKINGKVI